MRPPPDDVRQPGQFDLTFGLWSSCVADTTLAPFSANLGYDKLEFPARSGRHVRSEKQCMAFGRVARQRRNR